MIRVLRIAIATAYLLLTACGPSNPQSSSIKAIVGPDDRQVVSDERVGVLFNVDTEGGRLPWCTVFAVGEVELITASHCIPSLNLNYAAQFGEDSFTIAGIKKIESADIARLTVKESIPAQYILAISSSEDDTRSASDAEFTLTAFDPRMGKFVKSENGKLFPATGLTGDALDGVYFHDLDTLPGSSGAPILRDGEVVAVHVASKASIREGISSPLNIAVSINGIEAANVTSLYSENVIVEGVVEELKAAYDFVKSVFPEATKKVEEAIAKLPPDKYKLLVTGLAKVGGTGKLIGDFFDLEPIYGPKYDIVQNPLAASHARNSITYKGFRLGNNSFDPNSPCADRLAATTNLTENRAHVFVKFSSVQPGAVIPKPIKYTVKLNGLCGLQNEGKMRVLERKGGSTYKVEAEAPIPTDWQSIGYGRYSFSTYSEQIAIEFGAGVVPENGDSDDFLVENVVIEVEGGLQAQAENSKICKTELFRGAGYTDKCWGMDNDFSNDWWLDRRDRGPGSGSYLCGRSDEIRSMRNSCGLPASVCDADGYCAYAVDGSFFDFSGLGLKKIVALRVAARPVKVLNDFGITKCSQLTNSCPAELQGERMGGSKVVSDPMTRVDAQVMLIIAGIANSYKDKFGRYPDRTEMEQLLARLASGTVDLNTLLTGQATPSLAGNIIVSRKGEQMCMDWDYANNSGIAHNRNVVISQCHGGSNQKWNWDGELIRSSHDNTKCMDWDYANSSNIAHNRNVVVFDCHGGSNQRWFRDGELIRSRHDSTKCLDWDYANSSGTATGDNLVVFDCHGAVNQQWTWK
jgi:endo-1,4-beta-xylanase